MHSPPNVFFWRDKACFCVFCRVVDRSGLNRSKQSQQSKRRKKDWRQRGAQVLKRCRENICREIGRLRGTKSVENLPVKKISQEARDKLNLFRPFLHRFLILLLVQICTVD